MKSPCKWWYSFNALILQKKKLLATKLYGQNGFGMSSETLKSCYKSLDVIGYGRVIFKNSGTHRIKNNTFDLEKVGRNKTREQNSLTP